MKKAIISVLFFVSFLSINAQSNYAQTLEWVIETFSQNDAGFQYIVDKKGKKDYDDFTQGIKSRVPNVANDDEFVNLVCEWLYYFRKGHVGFGVKDKPNRKPSRSNFDDKVLHLDRLSDKTLYLRIPSFEYKNKVAIDSIIKVNKDMIGVTPNLIIDIRNGSGGSDASFWKLLPLLYTNPIRQVGLEFKGSELNAKGFEQYAEMTNNPSLNNVAKLLRENDKKFIAVETSDKTSVIKFDNILPYPQRVAILIDGGNVSSDEQFLIYAKQSWKVKLFGKTTRGAIDISNMTYTFSPDEKFYLSYAMSKSKRIPDFMVDDIGLQPDFYIDSEIPEAEWINFTKGILEE
ncbi:peptidase S41-like protein [Dysgonomonas alginatilytica]|uniref:Peptidase S41-like protein n=1 Tax=Dysgonomonas alginatilytica TaxID=1605892 RepID=A0A2V3PPM6_9BACT|nr:S41 family peptidase [Dysgonomonas alginatilytica]PXV65417.1 peptidase S41-like protein [Dysgonomonas alginatilytica]